MATRPRITAALAQEEYRSLNWRQRARYQRGANQVSSNRNWTNAQRHAEGMRWAGRQSAGRAGG